MGNSAQFSDLYASGNHATSTSFDSAARTNDTGAFKVNRFPPHVHELLDHASAQLISQNQKALELGYEDGPDKTMRTKSPEIILPHGQCNMLAICRGKLESFDDHGTSTRITAAGSGYSYAHAPKTRFGDQQSDPHRKKQIQINYLDCLAYRIPTSSSLYGELQAKESLRVVLTKIAREALERHVVQYGYTVGPKSIDLKCFGSLRNGFMLPNTDLDLMVRMHPSTFPKDLERECPRILEKAFLDAGLGAYLLPNTMTPIIKLCEKPSKELLSVLDGERGRRQINETHRSFSHQTSYHSDFYYSGHTAWCLSDTLRSRHRADNFGFSQTDVGIRGNINFSGRLPLYSTELLRCYALCDERVRLVGVFVKMWAKARKINDPYRGTMCSYGYILMVIHYLMNIANPPLIPNLQAVQQPFSGHVEITNINGYDVRFLNDESELRAISRRNKLSGNQQSVGELLRGFFAYYGNRGSRFHWVNNVISIRVQGGIIPKHEKGWNTAKNDRDGNRLRFLLAIEDPFEHENNVAATVTEAGVNAIRAEFNRAQTIINRIQEIPGVGWEWRTDEGDVGQDLLAEAQDQSSSYSSRRLKNTGSRTPIGAKHRDCVPELCTAQMDDNIGNETMPKSSGSGGHLGDIPGSHSSCAQMEFVFQCSAKHEHPSTFHRRAFDYSGFPTTSGPNKATEKYVESQCYQTSGVSMPSAPVYNCEGSFLTDPVTPSNTEGEQGGQEPRRPTGLAVKSARCSIYTQEPQDIKSLNTKFQSSNQLPPGLKLSSGPSCSEPVGYEPKPILQNSEGAFMRQHLTVTSASHVRGVSLDVRQFHGPGAIRDRRATSKHHRSAEFLDSSPEDHEPVVSNTESTCRVDIAKRNGLLANPPFGA